MAGAGAFADLAQGLMERHYDPRYAKHRARIEVRLAEVDAGSLQPETLPDTAARVAGAVQGLL
jgi:tRNA 2-selenouridine synthase